MKRSSTWRRWSTAAVAGMLGAGTVVALSSAGRPAANPAPRLAAAQAPALPRFARTGGATQLIVRGQPFLMLGGELRNSDSSTTQYLDNTEWPTLGTQADLNTILVPVSWAQWEPTQGHFDPALVDDSIRQARKYGKKIVFVWFGSWKNSDSSYAPSWVKHDQTDYPLARVEVPQGGTAPVDVLSPFGTKTRDADAAAFAALMGEVKKQDPEGSTVIMTQVENEVGLLSASRDPSQHISSRDESDLANTAWQGQVPTALTDYLAAHTGQLQDEVRQAWTSHGSRRTGTWAQVFGDTPQGQEIFMAWAYSTYVDAVAAAGKRVQDLPMYINTWIVQPDTRSPGGSTPGDYPSGGAVVGVRDVWRAGAPHIDVLAPDIYLPQYQQIWDEYAVAKGQRAYPNFTGESSGAATGAANSFYSIGQGADGYAPFGIESYPGDTAMKTAYQTLHQLSGQIATAQQQGTIASVWLSPSAGTQRSATVTLNGYTLTFTLSGTAATATGYALVLADGPDRFTIAGDGVLATFTPHPDTGRTAAIDTDEEGTLIGGHDANGGDVTGATWSVSRVLNGDETSSDYYFGDEAAAHQSPVGVKLSAGTIQRVSLYTY